MANTTEKPKKLRTKPVIHATDPKKFIVIRGARVHNLKNVDLDIPKNKIIVFTGVSGSGKSSLVFDTIYAEGQRRYVESLSSYARQFLERINKPDVDFMAGLAPSMAIEQKTQTKNPRSTVGTMTEIYDYLRLLFARTGKTLSPVSGKQVSKDSPESITDELIATYGQEPMRLFVMIDVTASDKNDLILKMKNMKLRGFYKVAIEGETEDLNETDEESIASKMFGTKQKKKGADTSLKYIIDINQFQ